MCAASRRRFQERTQGLGQHPLVGEARGVGLVGALELVATRRRARHRSTRRLAVAAYVGARAQARGVITRCLGDCVDLCPPLIITEAEVGDLMDGIKLALDDALEWVEARMPSP